MLRQIFLAAWAALKRAASFSLWLLLLPLNLFADRGETDIPSAPARVTPPMNAAGLAESEKADLQPEPDLDLQAASAISVLYRRVQGWPYRDELSPEKFSVSVRAWLDRLTGDEARAAVMAGTAALSLHLQGRRPIDGLPALYGRRKAPASRVTVRGRRRSRDHEPDEEESLNCPYLAAARI